MAKTKVTLVGCGRTGLTIAHGIKAAMKDIEVVGHDKERDVARLALGAKAIDREEWNLPKACDGAALVIIAIPSSGVELTVKSIAKDVGQGGTVCIVGGSNAANLALAERHLAADVGLISSNLVLHPEQVAPGAQPGPGQLKNAVWSIAARGSEDQIGAFSSFVTLLGAQPVFVDPAERDGMSLSVDALPAMLDSLLMLTVSGDAAWRERGWAAGAQFAADTAGAPRAPQFIAAMMANRPAMTHWLNQFMLQCMALRDAVEEGDAAAIEKQLASAEARREAWLSNWRKGRDTGAAPIEPQGRSMLSVFVGQRMADKISKRPSGK